MSFILQSFSFSLKQRKIEILNEQNKEQPTQAFPKNKVTFSGNFFTLIYLQAFEYKISKVQKYK